jgi:hypothetical protein
VIGFQIHTGPKILVLVQPDEAFQSIGEGNGFPTRFQPFPKLELYVIGIFTGVDG